MPSLPIHWFALLLPLQAMACWEEAGDRYGVSPHLLHAIAQVESRLDPRARNDSHFAKTGSYDIGLMQINSSNLAALARYGIDERALLNPCISIHVGAWLLADSFRRHGPVWDAVGAYNASCSRLKGDACTRARARYAWRVHRHLQASALDGPFRPTSAIAATTAVRDQP